jgi:4-amino-4-deoxychorismate lyase
MSLLFESIRVVNYNLFNIEYHNARVNESRARLFSARDPWDLRSMIHFPELQPDIIYKCRFTYAEEKVSVEFQKYSRRTIHTLKLMDCPDLEYKFKYLDRFAFDRIKHECPGFDDVLIVQHGRITDSSFANIIFFDGVKWLTPSSALLKGTKRQKYLDNKVIFEEEIFADDLKRFSQARLINAMLDLEESPDIPVSNIFWY